jgi:hypothetical protein
VILKVYPNFNLHQTSAGFKQLSNLQNCGVQYK